jgi:predicted nuclease of predicted toxin-antitoxin system
VRLLVDANLSPAVAALLNQAGHDAVAVRDLGLQDATDETILEQALADDRVIVSHDTDFGTMLAMQRRSKPSLILIRSADPLTTTQIAALIVDNLEVMVEDLTAGAIITFARGHLRSRRLPLQ